MAKNINGFSKEVEELYCNYDWPGNVRELENAIEYGVNMAFADEITILEVPPRIRRSQYSSISLDGRCSLQQQLKKLEKQILECKIIENGNTHQAKLKIASELGISRATLYRKLDEYDLS